MSILIVGGAEDRVEAAIELLLAHGDEVRVVERDPARAETWSALGAHVAQAQELDADLVERAAQNCRTVVIVDGGAFEAPAVAEILEGAAAARVERAVVCTAGEPEPLASALRAARMQYVLLTAGGRKRLFTRAGWAVTPEQLAAAIDAADDLGGDVRVELDLTEVAAWAELGLDPP